MDTIKHLHHLHLSTTLISIHSDVTMHLALRNLPSTLDLLFRSFPRFSEIVAQCLEVYIRRVSSARFSMVSSRIIGCSHVLYLALSSLPWAKTKPQMTKQGWRALLSLKIKKNYVFPDVSLRWLRLVWNHLLGATLDEATYGSFLGELEIRYNFSVCEHFRQPSAAHVAGRAL